MEYLSTKQAAAQAGLSNTRMVQLLRLGRVAGAFRVGRYWCIPADAIIIRKKRGRPAKIA